MNHMERQGDMRIVKEDQKSGSLKRSSPDNLSTEKASLERALKRWAADKEVECHTTHDEGDESSNEQVSQPATSDGKDQSQIESNNSHHPVESLQSGDYWDSLFIDHDEREEQLEAVPKFTFDPITLRRKLAKMIILHEYPISVVDHIGFKDFLSNLNPVFGMVSQTTVENDIMKIFKFERSNVYTELSAESEMPSGRIAIATKSWNSSDGNRRFLAITGHVIDHEGKKQSFIMRFANVPLPCTNESICEIILECISYFEVANKLSTITVDSYTSDKELIDNLVDKLSGNKLLFRGKLFQLPCFAHTMSLIVQDGFDLIRHVLEKIRASIVFWTSSPEREMALKKATSDLGVSTATKLLLDDGLSWSSTYLMLQQSFVFKGVFFHLGQQESQYKSLPSDEEWDLAREVCNRLQLLYEEMKLLVDCPAACFYIMHLCDIKLTLSEWLDCEVPGIKEMSLKMLEKFDKYWFAVRDIVGVAAVFHPEYRFFLLKYYFPKIYGNEAESELERIRQIFNDLFMEYKSSLPKDESDDDDLNSRFPNRRILYRLFIKERKKKEREKCEVDLYLKESRYEEIEDSGILFWWEKKKQSYPVLHKMAKDILAIPIFSVDVEDAFDVGDRILGANRSRLPATMVEALMCTQRWIRRWKNSDSKAFSSATNLHSLGTIYDDAKIEHGIIFKAKSADSGDKSDDEPIESPG